MLLRQHGGGHQHRHLLAVCNRFERRPQRHLRLSVTHIAADQAVHRARVFHIALHFLHHPQLVFRFDIGEAGFQLLLPGGIHAESMSFDHAAPGVQLEQVFSHFLHGFADLGTACCAILRLPAG